LLVREDKNRSRFGEDSLDPPLWTDSEHLLSESSHKLATQVLDEFLRTHGETLVRNRVRPREATATAVMTRCVRPASSDKVRTASSPSVSKARKKFST